MIFDPTYPLIDQADFKVFNWKEFYGGAMETITPNASKPMGKEFDLSLFCDSDHAGDSKTWQPPTEFFICLNTAPIVWLSKKQPTIETSVFDADFVAMKIGMENLRGLWYKLRMMGIPLSGPSYIYGDNMYVIHNMQ